jgi:MFS transporter, MHS family, shikimate and dehydroshikimate transport protein
MSTPEDPDRTGRQHSDLVRTVTVASAVGTTIEYYDFVLYASAAALVFNKVFFPAHDPMIGAVAAFATFFVGYLARLLGGLLFGHFGDRMGRKRMLVATLLIMGLGTVAIGLLPTYSSIGVWAPLLLLIIRLLQGLGMGGEYGGGAVMTVEHAREDRRGFYGALVHIGTPAGVLLPTALLAALSAGMSKVDFMAWGWRIPFLASIVLIGLGIYVRLRITESPEFQALRRTTATEKAPLIRVLRDHPMKAILSIGAKIAESGLFNVYYVVAISYVTTELHIPQTAVLTGVLIGCALECCTLPMFGALSDRIGRRPVYVAGALFQILLAVPFFLLLNTRQPVLITLAITLGLAVGHGCMYGPQCVYPVSVRYTGLSLTQQVGSTLGGGLSPLIATALLSVLGGIPWLVAGYAIGVAALSGLCAQALRSGERTSTVETGQATVAAR